jgi:hypothetical protein
MKAILSRTYGPHETKSTLFVMNGEALLFRCKCIELPNNGNQKNTSCIPEGVYNVEKYHSPTKGDCFWVKDVPGRDSILIHKGNYAAGDHKDTLGCILPGTHFVDINDDGYIDIGDSTKTMENLLAILTETFKLYIL